jgi:polyhydroxybutyrate depolymerase
MEASTGFSNLADQQNFTAVYPQGIKDDDGLPMWASVGPAADYGIDDLAFTNNLLDKLQKELCINPNRIYATGFSNGGGMSHYLACKLAGRIAAVVPIAGNYFPLPNGDCQPSRAVALLEIHGTADNVISYNGRPDKDYPGWPLPSMPDYLAGWARRNGCNKGPQTFLDTKEIKGEAWSDCRDNSTVAHYQIKGGGHAYPDSLGGHSSSEVIWSFLFKYVLHP